MVNSSVYGKLREITHIKHYIISLARSRGWYSQQLSHGCFVENPACRMKNNNQIRFNYIIPRNFSTILWEVVGIQHCSHACSPMSSMNLRTTLSRANHTTDPIFGELWLPSCNLLSQRAGLGTPPHYYFLLGKLEMPRPLNGSMQITCCTCWHFWTFSWLRNAHHTFSS